MKQYKLRSSNRTWILTAKASTATKALNFQVVYLFSMKTLFVKHSLCISHRARDCSS